MVTQSAERVREQPQFDYATVGHVTADVLADGSRRPGGTAFYSALQAARLGLHTLVLTRGEPREIAALLAPYRGEFTLRVSHAAHTTTLQTSGEGERRRQRLIAWAGPMSLRSGEVDAAIVHLAPIARELSTEAIGAGFVGLTGQGLLRHWAAEGGEITLAAPSAEEAAIARRCDALVVSERERASAAALIAAARRAGATVVVTDGPRPNTVFAAGGAGVRLPVPEVLAAREDLGAGDVFASALFVELAGGASPEQATAFANAAAAVRMCGDGAGAVGDRAAIEARAVSAAS
jgi:sugar/nucleoside kinase (ribokinase family)